MAGPVNLTSVQLYDQTPRVIPKFLARWASADGLSRTLCLVFREHVLLHHPYDSYSAVVRFIESSQTPDVSFITSTATSEDSPIVRALVEAAAKKEVTTVVVELKARFDEVNIRWRPQELARQAWPGLKRIATSEQRHDSGWQNAPVMAHLGTGKFTTHGALVSI